MSQRPEDAHTAGHGEPPVSAQEALRRLADGNARFLRGESRFTGMRREDLDRLATGQQPFATILGCADSRVPPELIFDAVLGELFVIRVAGNVLSAEVAGSMQYAGAHLRTPLFVVLGHEGCGAVTAAIESQFEGVQHRSRIQNPRRQHPSGPRGHRPAAGPGAEAARGCRSQRAMDRATNPGVPRGAGPHPRGPAEAGRGHLRTRVRTRPVPR